MHTEEFNHFPTSEGIEMQVLDVNRDEESSPEILEESAINYFSLAHQSAQRQVSVVMNQYHQCSDAGHLF